MSATDRFCKLSRSILDRKDLKATDKVVHAYLLDRMGAKEACWPGVRTIARDCGLSTDTVQVATRRLETAGLIHVDRQNPRRTYYRRSEPSCPEESDVREVRTCRESVHLVPKTGTEVCRKSAPKKTDSMKTHTKAEDGCPDVVWGPDEQRFVVSPEQRARWKRDFPTVDVDAELRRAGAWHAANKRWRSRFKAALTRWLANSDQKRSGAADSGRFTPAVADPSIYDAAVTYLGDTDE